MPQIATTRWILSIILFGVSAVLSATDDAPGLAVVQVNYMQLPYEQVYDAVIEAVNQATLSAQTSGRVMEINVDVDDFVAKGSVVLRFRNKKQKAVLKEAKARLKEAETRFEEAGLEFERIKGIYSKKLLPKAAFDKAMANHKATSQRLDQAKARLAQAQEEFDRTIVLAPYAGIVVKRHIEVGETAKVGQALITGYSMDALRALTKVPQSIIGLIDLKDETNTKTHIIYQDMGSQISTASAASNKGQANKIKRVAATRVTLNPYGDPDTHTFSVRVGLPKGLQGLYPGMMVKVAFVTGQANVLLVPMSSVIYRSEVAAIYVVKPDGHIAFRQVRVGNKKPENMIEVLAGLEAGEKIALDPVKAGIRLKDQNRGINSGNGS